MPIPRPPGPPSRSYPLLLVVCLLGGAGCGPDARAREGTPATVERVEDSTEGSASAGHPARMLIDPTVVLAATATADDRTIHTSLRDLHFDVASGSLFAADPGLPAVLEFGVDGTLRRRFGARRGAGPTELAGVEASSVSPATVAILDRRNVRILLLSRRGTETTSIPAASTYRGIAISDRGEVLAAPSAHGGLVDVLRADSGYVRTLGSRGALPIRCDDDAERDCARERRLCPSCILRRAPAGRYIFGSLEESLLRILDARGRVVGSIDLTDGRFPIARWREADAPLLDEANRRSARGVRVESLKQYLLGLDVLPDGRLAMPVAPSLEEVRDRGREFWLLDPVTGGLERYAYPTRDAGYAAATDGTFVYAVALPYEALRRYALPDTS